MSVPGDAPSHFGRTAQLAVGKEVMDHGVHDGRARRAGIQLTR
jgi:hypothetical protein